MGTVDLAISIVADKQRITQVISNLLDNAVKFTKHGFIIIRTKKKKDNNGEAIIVSIEDTGSGIAQRYYLYYLQNLLPHHGQYGLKDLYL